MKNITFAILVLLTITATAQNKKDLTIAIATGKLTSPYYHNAKARGFSSFDFDYHLTKRQILSANFNSGSHNFLYENPTTPIWFIDDDGTNSKVEYKTFSILYKFKFIDKDEFSGNIGTGAGIMTHSATEPYSPSPTSHSFQESTWSDLTFPIRLDLDYKLSKQFKLGLVGGFFIQPDFPILAYHAGARLSFTLK